MTKIRSSFGPGRESIPEGKKRAPERLENKNLRENPDYSEIIRTVHRLEQEKDGKPDMDDLTEKLSEMHGRQYNTKEVREQLAYLEKTPSNHKIVNRSMIRGKVSLTQYGRQILEQ